MLFTLFFLLIIAGGLAIGIRELARRRIWWVFVPTNTFALVTTEKNKDVDLTKGGGRLSTVIHSIPGKKLNRTSADPMEWFFEDGEESHGLLNHLLGVQWVGPFRYLQTNKIKSFRYTREDQQSELSVKPKESITEFIFYTSEQAVEVKSAETADIFEIKVVFNIILANMFPVRSTLKVADSNAVLSQLVEAETIKIGGAHDIKDFLSGTNTQGGTNTLKTDLTKAVKLTRLDAQGQVGVDILEVNLLGLDPTDKTRTILELESVTKLQNEAVIAQAEAEKKRRIIVAEGRKQEVILANDAAEDELERIILRTANNPGAITVNGQNAYRDNKTVTTYAPGGNGLGLIINPTQPAPIGPSQGPTGAPAVPVPATPAPAPASQPSQSTTPATPTNQAPAGNPMSVTFNPPQQPRGKGRNNP